MPRRMAGNFADLEAHASSLVGFAFVQQNIGRGAGHFKPKWSREIQVRVGQHRCVTHSDYQRRLGPTLFQSEIPGNVVAVAMRAKNGSRSQLLLFEVVQNEL